MTTSDLQIDMAATCSAFEGIQRMLKNRGLTLTNQGEEDLWNQLWNIHNIQVKAKGWGQEKMTTSTGHNVHLSDQEWMLIILSLRMSADYILTGRRDKLINLGHQLENTLGLNDD